MSVSSQKVKNLGNVRIAEVGSYYPILTVSCLFAIAIDEAMRESGCMYYVQTVSTKQYMYAKQWEHA